VGEVSHGRAADRSRPEAPAPQRGPRPAGERDRDRWRPFQRSANRGVARARADERKPAHGVLDSSGAV